MSDTELARRVAELERRQHRAMFELLDWQVSGERTVADSKMKWKEISARHGLVPPPAVGKGERWFRSGNVPTCEWRYGGANGSKGRWFRDGEDRGPAGFESAELCSTYPGVIELDPRTGAPLAVPAATMEERALEAWTSPSIVGVPGQVRLANFARSETSALAAENERLRGRVAELEGQLAALKDATGGDVGAATGGKWAYAAFKFLPDGATIKGDGVKRKPSPRRAPARGKKKGVKK